jgi:hypothetical protein
LADYTFGPFRLDPEAGILFRRGEPVALGPRAVGLLRVLVERCGLPVSKDTLMETAWTGLAVLLCAQLRRTMLAPGRSPLAGLVSYRSRKPAAVAIAAPRCRWSGWPSDKPPRTRR